MPKQRFIHFPNRPRQLTAKFVKQEYQKLLKRLPAAEASDTADLWIKLFQDWNSFKAYMSGEASRVGYAFNKKMNDKRLQAAEKYLREKVWPITDKPEHELSVALVKSRHRPAIGKRFGKHLPLIYELSLKTFDPINTPLHVKCGKLTTDYSQIIAGATVKVRGETLNLSKARSLLFDEDESLRREAYMAIGDWVLKNHHRLNTIFSKLVKLRDQIAKNLKYKTYVEYSYDNHLREGYTEADVNRFRQSIQKYFVKINSQLDYQNAKALGKKSIKPWDMLYYPQYSLPRGSVPVAKQLAAAKRLFNQLSPHLAKHFQYMRRNGLIDLEARQHKFSNPYCMPISDEAKVAILLNSTGDPDDVRVLVHEMGHAFQMYESMPIEAIELQSGTAELSEIYSMGMEFLSLQHLNEFFKPEEVKKSAAYKWIESASTLCYVAIVDEFQHWIYRHVEATPDERDKQWYKIFHKYMPAVDFRGIEKYKSVRWYIQNHIFNWPFYYIDYALAEICAMQLGVKIKTHHRQTINQYLELCKLGGTRSFIDTIAAAGLSSPFEPPTIAALAKWVKQELSLK